MAAASALACWAPPRRRAPADTADERMFLRLACWLIAAHDVSVRAEEGDTWNAEAPVALDAKRTRAGIFMLALL